MAAEDEEVDAMISGEQDLPDSGYRGDGSAHVEKARLDYVNATLDDAVRNPLCNWHDSNEIDKLFVSSTIDELLAENGFGEKDGLHFYHHLPEQPWILVNYRIREHVDANGNLVYDLLADHDLRTGKKTVCYYEGLPYKTLYDLACAVSKGKAFGRIQVGKYEPERYFSPLAGVEFAFIRMHYLLKEWTPSFSRHKPSSVGTKEDPLAPIREALKIPYRAPVKVRVAPVEEIKPAAEPALAELEQKKPKEKKRGWDDR